MGTLAGDYVDGFVFVARIVCVLSPLFPLLLYNYLDCMGESFQDYS